MTRKQALSEEPVVVALMVARWNVQPGFCRKRVDVGRVGSGELDDRGGKSPQDRPGRGAGFDFRAGAR